MLDLACSSALVATALIVAIVYAGRVFRAGPAHHARVERAGGSALLGKGVMEMGYWALRPVARGCVDLGISANGVSGVGFALAALAGLALAVGHFGVGAALSTMSSACDAVDGLVARESGTAGDAGEVLDAAVDRYAELFFLGGVAFHERLDAPILLLALTAAVGAMMVSYSTAKAEALGVEPPRGAMRRQERAVACVLGATLVPLVAVACQRWSLPGWLAAAPLAACLGLIAVVGNGSACRRLRAVALAASRRALLSLPSRARTDVLAREPDAAGNPFH